MSKHEPKRYQNDRGFTVYDEFNDRRGHKVRVQQSSSATEDSVWIFVNDQLATVDHPACLNVEQATRVRDALDAFIAERKPRSDG